MSGKQGTDGAGFNNLTYLATSRITEILAGEAATHAVGPAGESDLALGSSIARQRRPYSLRFATASPPRYWFRGVYAAVAYLPMLWQSFT